MAEALKEVYFLDGGRTGGLQEVRFTDPSAQSSTVATARRTALEPGYGAEAR